MKKNTILKVVSIVLALATILAIVCAVTVTGSGFLDLSNLARMVYSGAAIIFASLSVLTWKIDNKANRKTKVIVWVAIIAIIIILTIICSLYRVPAVEIIS